MLKKYLHAASGFACALAVLVLLNPAAARADTTLDLAEYRGKVVVVDFWASWCVPCRRSFPWMNAMQDKYADSGLVIIAINTDADALKADKFLQTYPANFEIINDPQGKLARSFDVIAMPSSFVFDRDGDLVASHLGFKVKRKKEYESVLLEALGSSAE